MAGVGMLDHRVVWILAVAGFCFLLIAIGLLGAVVFVSGLESEQERRRERWEEARAGD